MIRVSVVVPTYRRPELLGRCLAALAAQDLDPSAFEVIVADDAASEATRRQVEAFARRSAATVRYVAVTGRHGPAAARNVGWRAARGDDHRVHGRRLHPRPALAGGGRRGLRRRTSTPSAGRVVVPLPSEPTDYERDAAGLERAEFVTANCFCPPRRPRGGRRLRRAVRRRLARGQRPAVRPAAARAGGSSGPTGAVVVHPVRPAPWGVSLAAAAQEPVRCPALQEASRPVPAADPARAAAGTTTRSWRLLGLAVGRPRGSASPRRRSSRPARWAVLTARFCARRLRRTSRAPRHVAEMVVTSALIPPLSVFWRLYGACKFRVLFV